MIIFANNLLHALFCIFHPFVSSCFGLNFLLAIFQSLILSSTASNMLLNSSIVLFLVIVFSVLEFVSSLHSFQFSNQILVFNFLKHIKYSYFKILV